MSWNVSRKVAESLVECLHETIQTPTNKEPLKHLLISSPKGVRKAIHALHSRGYAEVTAWSPLQPTANPGEVISVLLRYIWR